MNTTGLARHTEHRGERLASLLVWTAALAVTATFAWILFDLVAGGLGQLSWEFLSTPPSDAGRSGGIAPILVSTLLILAVAMAVSVPIGVSAAALLAEASLLAKVSQRRDRLAPGLSKWVRRSLDVLAGMPSIVFGLFGNALFSRVLGMGFSILSGGLTLACMVLPILIRTTEESLRAVGPEIRQGAAALALSRTTTLFRLLLPAAAPGLTVGLVLGVGRALAETAALIFTSGYVDRRPESLLDSGRSLSIHIYDLSMNVPGGEANAYGSALVLLVLLLVINLTASSITARWLAAQGARR